MRPTQPLSTYTTRALLSMREYPGEGFDADGKLPEYSQGDIHAELSTREHVPNKQEAKALRQARAKAGRNKGRRNR